MMTNTTKYHALVTSALLAALTGRLGRQQVAVLSSDFGVETNVGVRFPDILVDADPTGSFELRTQQPLVIGEVLSLSTHAKDFGEKFNEYTALETLKAYVILAQEKPCIWLWERDQQGDWPEDAIIIDDISGVLKLSHFDMEIPLEEIYHFLTLKTDS